MNINFPTLAYNNFVSEETKKQHANNQEFIDQAHSIINLSFENWVKHCSEDPEKIHQIQESLERRSSLLPIHVDQSKVIQLAIQHLKLIKKIARGETTSPSEIEFYFDNAPLSSTDTNNEELKIYIPIPSEAENFMQATKCKTITTFEKVLMIDLLTALPDKEIAPPELIKILKELVKGAKDWSDFSALRKLKENRAFAESIVLTGPLLLHLKKTSIKCRLASDAIKNMDKETLQIVFHKKANWKNISDDDNKAAALAHICLLLPSLPRKAHFTTAAIEEVINPIIKIYSNTTGTPESRKEAVRKWKYELLRSRENSWYKYDETKSVAK